MSHYAKLTIQAQQKYEGELIASLKKRFGADGVEVHGDSKVELLMWNGTKSNLKANIVIRKDTVNKALGRYVAANDLGYERNKEGGYNVHADPANFSKDSADAIAQHYAELVAVKRLKQKGFKVTRSEIDGGRIQLHVTT